MGARVPCCRPACVVDDHYPARADLDPPAGAEREGGGASTVGGLGGDRLPTAAREANAGAAVQLLPSRTLRAGRGGGNEGALEGGKK